MPTAARSADGREVGLSAGRVARQALAAGLLDGPEVTPGTGVTYLRYRVRRS